MFSNRHGLKPEDFAPCPFCKHQVFDLLDAFHPTGTYWRKFGDEGMRSYHSSKEYQPGDEQCWVYSCLIHEGGCGAEMHGDSAREVHEKWNRRAT